jgi:c-di-GMP-binding flagellar brake protein YcgR
MPLRRLLNTLKKRLKPPPLIPDTPAIVEPTFDALAASFSTLQTLMNERVFLQVRLPTLNDATYQSLILEVDSEHNKLVIDDLFPRDVGPDITEGVPVEVFCKHQGLRLHFESVIESITLVEGNIAYQLRVPTQVESKQQRKHFRVHIPLDSGVKLMTDVPNVSMASVLNLSSIGIGLLVPGNVEDIMRSQRVLKNCRLQLPLNMTVMCSVQVRSVQFKAKPTRRTIVGGELTGISVADQKKLDQHVFSLQRLQRQRETRVE